MPVNLTQNSTVTFIVEFFDSNLVPVIPSSVTLAVAYTSLTGASTSARIPMTQEAGNLFTAVWGSGVAALGWAGYLVYTKESATIGIDELRIVD